ncbi:MAG: hypothetical protein GY841_03850, partial [FCB group bacterium]|nr:hypothetical protein [FCB group bacterium]
RDLRLRQPGQSPFSDPTTMRNFLEQSFDMYRKLMERTERAFEDMAAQVLTTGKITLVDDTAETIFVADFKPKSTHFTTAAVPWSTIATSDPIADLTPLCQVIRDDGLTDRLTSLWDTDSFEFAKKSTLFQAALSKEVNIDTGSIVRLRQNARGEQYRGSVDLGNFSLDIWTYNGRRVGPDGSTKGPYIPRKKVIVFDPNARYDAYFGSGDQRLVPIDPRLSRFVPTILRSSKSGVQMTPNAWVDDQGTAFWGAASTRLLAVPVHLDAIGCLDTDLA